MEENTPKPLETPSTAGRALEVHSFSLVPQDRKCCGHEIFQPKNLRSWNFKNIDRIGQFQKRCHVGVILLLSTRFWLQVLYSYWCHVTHFRLKVIIRPILIAQSHNWQLFLDRGSMESIFDTTRRKSFSISSLQSIWGTKPYKSWIECCTKQYACENYELHFEFKTMQQPTYSRVQIKDQGFVREIWGVFFSFFLPNFNRIFEVIVQFWYLKVNICMEFCF